MSAKSMWIFLLFSAATAKRFGESQADIRAITTDVMEDFRDVDQLKDDGQLVSGPQAAKAGEIDPEGLKLALYNADEVGRRQAAFALAKMGKKAAPYVRDLRSVFQWDYPRVREACAYALGDIGKEAAPALPELTQALWRDRYEVELREAAGYALGRIGREAPDLVLPYLRQVLQGHYGYAFGYACQETVRALGIMGLAASEAIPELRTALKKCRRPARKGAVEALKVLGATSAIPELKRALFDRYYEVGVAAAATLGSMGKQAIEAVPSLAKAIHYFLFEHAYKRQKKKYDQETSAWRVAAAAANALSAMGEAAAPAIPELQEVAKSKEWYAKEEAGKALQAIGEAARRNSKCCCIDRKCRKYEMGSTGLSAVNHPPLERAEKGRCCKVYAEKCTRGFKSLLKKAPEEQPDFQACEVSAAGVKQVDNALAELGASMTDAN